MLILPTWLVFRYAPGYPRHTIPEGFFLQVFLSVQALLLSIFGYCSNNVELVLYEVYTVITYHQLFGYRWLSTLWRFVVVALVQVAVFMMLVVIMIYFFVLDSAERAEADTILAYLVIFSVTAVVTTAMLTATHLINKRTSNGCK